MNSCSDGTEPLGESPDLPRRTPPADADRPIVFCDTETLGLHPDAPIWEFACVRVDPNGDTEETVFTIQHDPSGWVHELRIEFQRDYYRRYKPAVAVDEMQAVEAMAHWTRGAILVGCNPGFDVQRIEKLFQHYDIEPSHHYHPLDTASMALAWLWARGVRPPQPWKSDELSRLIGVDPAQFDRHTALGDAKWCRAQWDRMQR